MRSHLNGLLGVLVQGGSLRLEDGHVGLQQVLPLHPLLPGHGAHQDGGVDVLEADLHLVSGDHLCGGRRSRCSAGSRFTLFLYQGR